jgi:hypothetical protein
MLVLSVPYESAVPLQQAISVVLATVGIAAAAAAPPHTYERPNVTLCVADVQRPTEGPLP